jgi:hypothetical protein
MSFNTNTSTYIPLALEGDDDYEARANLAWTNGGCLYDFEMVRIAYSTKASGFPEHDTKTKYWLLDSQLQI